MENKFNFDFYRYYERNYKKKDFILLLVNHQLMFLYLFRKYESTKNKLGRFIIKILLRKIKVKYGLEISGSTKIGKGFYIGHPYNITINPETVLGSNINIHKGVTIGQENRGGVKAFLQLVMMLG